jgi:hypothetical protein
VDKPEAVQEPTAQQSIKNKLGKEVFTLTSDVFVVEVDDSRETTKPTLRMYSESTSR